MSVTKDTKVELTVEELTKVIAHFCEMSLSTSHNRKMEPGFVYGIHKTLISDFVRFGNQMGLYPMLKKKVILYDIDMLQQDGEKLYNDVKHQIKTENPDNDPLSEFYNDEE